MLHSRLTATLATLATLASLAACSDPGSADAAAGLDYPETPRGDHVDDYHGERVADPYRWLEDLDSEQTAAWVAAQNELTFGHLKAIPGRAAIRKRVAELWGYERYETPWKEGGRYFYNHNDGLQNQSVLYTLDELGGEPRVVLDPNTLSADGTVAVRGLSVSPDGKYLAYGVYEGGSDWTTWHVRDLATGEDLPDLLHWSKFSAAEWARDGGGFYYSRYDAPASDDAHEEVNYFQKVYFHRIDTPQSDDVLVHEDPTAKEHGFGASPTRDGRYLVLSTWRGTERRNLIHVRDLRDATSSFVPLFDDWRAQFDFLGNVGRTFYFLTDLDAPRSRIVAVDVAIGRKSLATVVPEREETLRGAALVGGRFVCNYLRDAQAFVSVHEVDGTHVRDVELPGIGSASGFGGQPDDPETFYTFSGFTTPPSIYRYDVATGATELYRRPDVEFDPSRYETKQVFYESKDGTRVPMFVTHRKGLVLDGTNPTLLYGYGGFNIAITPRFSVSRVVWMEMGGVYAVANLRGGGEYGKEWHEAGTKERKQNVFDDFIAAAEWLIAEGYTSTPRLGIQGGSNGGLLVGACMTQRPDLFGACLPAVGVMDMLRFHEFTIGWAWTSDYGCSDDPEAFAYLRAYSPYHNIEPGVAYPPTLVTTADTDDRVVPSHSFKFISALQHAQAGPAPVLIRIDVKAGHGAGKPTSMRIDEVADQWAFLSEALDVPAPKD